ncbi:MAG: hypothetical protein ABH834_03060, partial [Candidatus Altiarchaeota archaeon]
MVKANSKTRKERQNAELLAASKHMYYEFWMLGEALKKVCNPGDQQGLNCALESFGIHARVLTDFLFKSSGWEDDVLAIDYVNDPESWVNYINTKKGIRVYLTKRVGKEIAHLTYTRLNIGSEEKNWDCAKIHKMITELFLEFLN